MKKICCWEFKNCGREPGGKNVSEYGVCPVAVDDTLEGCCGPDETCSPCWSEVGTFCGGEIQGMYAKKLGNCLKCDYFDKSNFSRFVM